MLAERHGAGGLHESSASVCDVRRGLEKSSKQVGWRVEAERELQELLIYRWLSQETHMPNHEEV